MFFYFIIDEERKNIIATIERVTSWFLKKYSFLFIPIFKQKITTTVKRVTSISSSGRAKKLQFLGNRFDSYINTTLFYIISCYFLFENWDCLNAIFFVILKLFVRTNC